MSNTPTPPTPEKIEEILQRIDANDATEVNHETPASYLEGMRVGIMWATGQLEESPID